MSTPFCPEEVDQFLAMFKHRAGAAVRSHLKGYDLFKQPLDDGRVIVKELQYQQWPENDSSPHENRSG